MTDVDRERAAFEAWWHRPDQSVSDYAYDNAWAGWQAGRASLTLVPNEPTQAMGVAGNRAQALGASATVIYRQMFAAHESDDSAMCSVGAANITGVATGSRNAPASESGLSSDFASHSASDSAQVRRDAVLFDLLRDTLPLVDLCADEPETQAEADEIAALANRIRAALASQPLDLPREQDAERAKAAAVVRRVAHPTVLSAESVEAIIDYFGIRHIEDRARTDRTGDQK